MAVVLEGAPQPQGMVDVGRAPTWASAYLSRRRAPRNWPALQGRWVCAPLQTPCGTSWGQSCRVQCAAVDAVMPWSWQLSREGNRCRIPLTARGSSGEARPRRPQTHPLRQIVRGPYTRRCASPAHRPDADGQTHCAPRDLTGQKQYKVTLRRGYRLGCRIGSLKHCLIHLLRKFPDQSI